MILLQLQTDRQTANTPFADQLFLAFLCLKFSFKSTHCYTITVIVLFPPATGVRFKLVKSNSCSSRLELVGTGKINSLQQHQQMHQQISQNMRRDEEKRRSILHRLQEQQPQHQQQQPMSIVHEGEDTSLQMSTECPETAAEGDAAPGSNNSPTGEKCVKQIVERLETTRGSAATVATVTRPPQTNGATGNASVPPRIIDSKCIEKYESQSSSSSSAASVGQRTKPPRQLVINPSAVVAATEVNRAESPVITVNNSISIADSASSGAAKSHKESIYATAKELLEQKQKLLDAQQQQSGTPQSPKTKVVRNRNVDLALSIVKNQKSGGAPTTVNGSPASKEAAAKQESVKTVAQQKPILTTFSQQHQLKQQKDNKRASVTSLSSSKSNNSQDSLKNGKTGERTSPPVVGVSDKSGEAVGVNEDQKMVKWGSLNGTAAAVAKFDEKFYVSNDAKLQQKKVYDDMEFEEFEVYDTATAGTTTAAAAAAGNNNECYDSLNSNK